MCLSVHYAVERPAGEPEGLHQLLYPAGEEDVGLLFPAEYQEEDGALREVQKGALVVNEELLQPSVEFREQLYLARLFPELP